MKFICNINIFVIGGILMLMFACLMLMFGCREYQMYEYKTSGFELQSGDVFVSLDGFYGEIREVNGKKIAEYSFPYHLGFIVSIPYDEPFEGLIVKDVELIGEKTGRHYQLGEKKARKINDPRVRVNPKAEARTGLVSFGPLLPEEYEYENFTVRATIITIGEDGKAVEESILILMETDFRTESRSDWFDTQMSI